MKDFKLQQKDLFFFNYSYLWVRGCLLSMCQHLTGADRIVDVNVNKMVSLHKHGQAPNDCF